MSLYVYRGGKYGTGPPAQPFIGSTEPSLLDDCYDDILDWFGLDKGPGAIGKYLDWLHENGPRIWDRVREREGGSTTETA